MKIYKENNQAIPAVIVLPDIDAAPTGYTEITDIAGMEKYGVQGIDSLIAGWRDKKAVRDKLKTMVFTKMQIAVAADAENDDKFNLLSSAEKSIALHWFIVGKESWQTAEKPDDKYWTVKASDYRDWTTGVRKKKLKIIESLVFRRLLNVQEAKDVLLKMTQILEGTPIPIDAVTGKTTAAVTTRKMTDAYVEGVEGTLEDNAGSFIFESLFDFVDSRTGTSFFGKGFRELTHSFRTGHTAGSVADEILLVKGSSW